MSTTYYERPLLKEPVWIWAVPAYFYAGGVAGAAWASAALASVALGAAAVVSALVARPRR